MKIISWRMLTAAIVYMIAASLGAAKEMYDELSPGDMNLMFPEQNYIDPAFQGPLAESKADSAMRSLLFYKMLSSFRNQDVSPNLLIGPKWIPSGSILVSPEPFDISLLKSTAMKRIPDGVFPKARGPAKPVIQKWKIKKGKAGSQMICYFKLCAFRPPT